jgi:CRISPR-associated protein Cmx8
MSPIIKKGDSFILEYDLFALPTAQHKAGLAGLLLMIDCLRDRKIKPLPEKETVTGSTARIVFTRESMQTVFDDLYDAAWIEVKPNKKWKDKEPKRVEENEIEINGKIKKEKIFIYDAVQPKGTFLRYLFEDDEEVWVKLWRDMLWKTLRGIPLTRLCYEERAEAKPSSLASATWNSLVKSQEYNNKGKILTESISSAIFVGAEDSNAEKISFRGTVDHNLLLHFWSLVSLIYVPRILNWQRTIEQGGRIEGKENGFILAIPEPANLEIFVDDVKNLLKSMDKVKVGIRPKLALIDLIEEGGLEYLYHFVKYRIDREDILKYNLSALELFHLQKQGNRIKQLAAERLIPQSEIIRNYEQFREVIKNPLFKSLCLPNLLRQKSWYENADSLFNRYPMPCFIFKSDKTPKSMRFFGSEAKEKFRIIEKKLGVEAKGGKMTDQGRDDQLAIRIYRLIQAYANYRTEEKSGKKFKDFQNEKDGKNRIIYPAEYREAREKVCSDAFLAIRSRREQDFVEYFSGTICSVPQFLPETDYLMIAHALNKDWAKIKTLSMIALSAQSYLSETTTTE